MKEVKTNSKFVLTAVFLLIWINGFGGNLKFDPADDSLRFTVNGRVLNVFNEPVDSVLVEAVTGTEKKSAYCDFNGFFSFDFRKAEDEKIRFTLSKPDYNRLDTAVFFHHDSVSGNVTFRMFPKYKILLKGRVYVANTPIENVDVTISHSGNLFQQKTMGCYYDDENYWNCLYLGMFKEEIVTENPDDSVFISFSKYGFKPLHQSIKFSDYQGDVLKIKMRYSDTFPQISENSLGLKLAFPTGLNPGWGFSFSYYRLMPFGNFKRLMAGIEFSTFSLRRSVPVENLPGIPVSSFDTTYTSFFAGPSVVFFLNHPGLKKFSTYAGGSLDFSFADFNPVVQPFLGTRYFFDLSKCLVIEARYLSYPLKTREYNFSHLGNAFPVEKEYTSKRFLLNLGIQINF